MSIFAGVIITILAVLSAMHVLWGLGIWWPVRDEARLARTVVGQAGDAGMPPGPACFAVASALGAAALLTGQIAGWHLLGFLPGWVVTIGGWIVVAVFLFRGAITYTAPWHRLLPAEPFRTFDRLAYAPLCLGLGGGVAALLLA